MFTHALTLSTMGIKHYEEKIPTQLESNPRFSHQEADVGPLHYRVAVVVKQGKSAGVCMIDLCSLAQFLNAAFLD